MTSPEFSPNIVINDSYRSLLEVMKPYLSTLLELPQEQIATTGNITELENLITDERIRILVTEIEGKDDVRVASDFLRNLKDAEGNTVRHALIFTKDSTRDDIAQLAREFPGNIHIVEKPNSEQLVETMKGLLGKTPGDPV